MVMAKRLLIVACALLIGAQAYIRAQESVMLKVTYTARFKKCAEDTGLLQDEKILEVGKTCSSFYGRWMHRRDMVKDSLLSRGADLAEVLGQISQYPSPRESYALYTNYPAKGQLTYTDRALKDFVYSEEIEKPQWRLEAKDTVILGYTCGMATCTFRGRNWSVCYTEEIPTTFGPWKLNGLPGLILYACEDSGIFSFEAIGLEKGNGEKLSEPKLKKMNRVTREELRKLHQEMNADPAKFTERFGYSSRGWDAYGKPMVYKEKNAIFIENE
jgi:GLPGLI family protein